MFGGFPRLGMAEIGQAGIDNAGIAAGGAEMQVEFALAVTQQDHTGPYRRSERAASPVNRWPADELSGFCLSSIRMRAYLWFVKEV